MAASARLRRSAFGLVGGQERQLVHQHHHEREPGRGGEGAGDAAELPGPVVHLGDRGLQQLDHMAAAWQAYRWNSARPNDSSIRLGSSAHTCTHPEAMAGSKRRIRDQITEPFPDPVAPAISTCGGGQPQPPGASRLAPPDGQPGQVHLPA